jgi:hypothetical protein
MAMSEHPAEVSPEAFAVIAEFRRNRFLSAHDHLIRPDLYTPAEIATRTAILLKHNGKHA